MAISREELREKLDALPRLRLAALPTPVEALERLMICQEISESFGFSSLRSNGIVPFAVEGMPL